MIQLVGGAAAIVIDTVSYMASAIAVLLIHKPEPKPAPTRFDAEKSGVLAELREGLDAVFGNPIIRHAVSCAATSNLGTNMIFAVELIFMYRRLQLSPAVVGTILAVGSVGGILGALAASSIARRLGVGWTIIVSIFFGEFGLLALLILISGYFIAQFATPVYNITSVRLRQAIAPDRLQDRMNATARTVNWGTIPLGTFIGGILGTTIGIIPTILIGSVIAVRAVFWVLGRPGRSLCIQPRLVELGPSDSEAAPGLS